MFRKQLTRFCRQGRKDTPITLRRELLSAFAVLAGLVGAMPANASASPIVGILTIEGTLILDSNTMNWAPPPAGGETGFGSFNTIALGTGYFAAIPSPMPPTYSGSARDITRNPALAGAPPAPAFAPTDAVFFVPGFLSLFTAPGYAGLRYDLTFIPQSPEPICTGAEAVGARCRPDATSPITLTRTASGTDFELFVRGFFEDSTVADSRNFAEGLYTGHFGESISEIMAALGGSGSISVHYNAQFEAAATVPEPAALTLLATGLLAGARRLRRRRGPR
jgi:hypothetical protein